jgi:hypothetical protein
VDNEHIWAAGTIRDDEDNMKGAVNFFNGKEWAVQLEAGAVERFLRIGGIDNEHLWAVGGTKDSHGVIYYYDGTSWERQFETASIMRDLSVQDGEHVWAVSESAVYSYNGYTWEESLEGEEFWCICSVDPTHVWAANMLFNDEDEYGIDFYGEGSIYAYDGSTWNRQLDTDSAFVRLACTDTENIWAIGVDSMKGDDFRSSIYKYDGDSWDKHHEFGEILTAIAAYDDCNVWSAGETLHFFNGENWSELIDLGEPINDISVEDIGTVWLATSNGNIYLGSGL